MALTSRERDNHPYIANMSLALCTGEDFKKTNEVFLDQFYEFIANAAVNDSLYVPIMCRMCGTVYGSPGKKDGTKVMTSLLNRIDKVEFEVPVSFGTSGTMPKRDMPVARCTMFRASTQKHERYYFIPDDERDNWEPLDVGMNPIHPMGS